MTAGVQVSVQPPMDAVRTPFESAVADLTTAPSTDWTFFFDTRAYGGGFYRAGASATVPAQFSSTLPSTDSWRTFLVLATWVASPQNSASAVFDTLVGDYFEGSTTVNQQIAPADYQDASGRWWKVLDVIRGASLDILD